MVWPIVETVSATIICAFGDLSLVQSRLEAVPGVGRSTQRFNEAGAEIFLSLPKSTANEVARMVT